MLNDIFRYDLLIDNAMRDVVKEVLKKASIEGLAGDHHFLFSFATVFPGVSLSPKLLARYPEEMTIVLQYQYEDLQVFADYFSVKLSFDGIKEKIVIPFSAITSFADPGVKFGLKFNLITADTQADNPDNQSEQTPEESPSSPPQAPDTSADLSNKESANNNVVNINFNRDKEK